MNERDVLSERFEALVEHRDDSDWSDVARRGGLTRRRWIVVAAAAAAVTVLLAVPTISLGLSGGLPFFQASARPNESSSSSATSTAATRTGWTQA
jgi:hypothetical protein